MPTPALGNVVPMYTGVVPEGSPPTSYAAYATLNGDKGSMLKFAGLTILRSLLIAPGMAIAGVRGKQLLWGSLAASGFVSMSALVYCYALAQKAPENANATPAAQPAQVTKGVRGIGQVIETTAEVA